MDTQISTKGLGGLNPFRLDSLVSPGSEATVAYPSKVNVMVFKRQIMIGFLAVFLLTNCCARGWAQSTDSDGLNFKNLFNGKDLSGWVDVNTSEKTWRVKDGTLISTGKPIGVIRTEKQYENFIIEVEWKHMRAGGNSGIFLWSDATPGRNRLPLGMEVQMLELDWVRQHKRKDGTLPPIAYVHGELFGAGGMTAKPENPRGNRSKSIENRCLGVGQWNKYVIVAVDGSVKLSVNGKFVNGISQASVRKGYICLEAEGSEIHFRNLKIMELPGGMANKKNSAKLISLNPKSTRKGKNGLLIPARKKKKRKKRDPNADFPFKKIIDDPNLPRVLLIGDSISIGYTVPVRSLLKGKANVHRPLTNCGPTKKGVVELERWLGSKKWDVIHFNFGLHDLKYMGPNGENLADPKDPKNGQQVPPKEYERNLKRIVKRLKETGAKLVWRNTTPVPVGAKGRVVGDSRKYNLIAEKIMKENGIPTDDHYHFAMKRQDEIQNKADVHFSKTGSKLLAEKVVKIISEVLSKRN